VAFPGSGLRPGNAYRTLALLGLWDLRRLRERLAALGLDWDLPAYPPSEHASPLVDAMQVEILAAAGGAP
jgi:hypothetical protein